MREFVLPVRVYYEDTDAGGVVYHANYLKFMERARTEWLRSLGYEQDALREEQGIIFVVHSVELTFARPARFNDLLEASCRLASRGGATLNFEQQIRHEGAVLCRGRIKVACLDATTMRPRPMPAAIAESIDLEVA